MTATTATYNGDQLPNPAPVVFTCRDPPHPRQRSRTPRGGRGFGSPGRVTGPLLPVK